MATANITWVPFPGPNTSSQVLEYKKNTSLLWSTYNTYGPLTNSASVTGLLDNVYYDFRITTNCSIGGPSAGASQPNKIKFVCPNVVVESNTITSIDFDVFYGADDLTKIEVKLYNAASPTVLIGQQNKLLTVGHSSGIFSGIFTGLTPSTNYVVVVTIIGKLNDSIDCTYSISTGSAPACLAVNITSVTAS
jgi:hypothetical protein